MFRPLLFLLPMVFFQQLAHCAPHNNKISHFAGSNPTAIEIVNVKVERHGHGDFVRIGEYFNGGVEYRGRRCILRDDENVRAGLYFVVNFNKPLEELPKDLILNIYFILGRSFTPEKFEFKLPNERKKFTAEVYCGITSRPISQRINAWKIELVDGDGKAISRHKSYMWPKNM